MSNNKSDDKSLNGINLQNSKHDNSKTLIESWLNKLLKVEISDGRILVGNFLCTDRDLNIILRSCLEYIKEDDKDNSQIAEEPRMVGLVMIPGKEIKSIHVDLL